MRILVLLILISSCALFRPGPSLKTIEADKLLQSIKLIGEGKGRLSFQNQQYLFGYEAVLKNQDWIFAATIPLHGEEVLILPKLNEVSIPLSSPYSLEARIINELKILSKKDKKLSQSMANDFLHDLRSLNRFLLAKKLGLKRDCTVKTADLYECDLLKEKFQIFLSNKDLKLIILTNSSHVLEFHSQNLTDSIFKKSSYTFYSRERGSEAGKILSLELFWK